MDHLRSVVSYSEDTGEFTRIKTIGRNAIAGSIAGYIKINKKTGKAYRQIKIARIKVMAHRLAWFYVHGVWPDGQIDHEDGDGLNNRISNLRVVTQQVNSRNARLGKRNTSGRVGVYWHNINKKWIAQIVISGKLLVLGRFDNFDQACSARTSAEIEHGFHKNHGAMPIR